MLGNSQDGGDPEQIGLEGRGKMGYFSPRKWLQQKFDARAGLSFLSCDVYLLWSTQAEFVLPSDCSVSNFQKSSMVRLARYKAKEFFFGWWK